MQDTFARATHSAGRPSAARDDRVSCIQGEVLDGGRSGIGYAEGWICLSELLENISHGTIIRSLIYYYK